MPDTSTMTSTQCPRYAIHGLISSMNHFYTKTPSFGRIQRLLTDGGNWSRNMKPDHIALRSFRRDGGLHRIRSQLTIQHAWTPREQYEFPDKHVKAEWFSPNLPNRQYRNEYFPRIFASEIDERQLSQEAQDIIAKYVSRVENVLIIHNSEVCYNDFLKINEESNYAAWTLMHGTVVNHIAIPVHELNGRNTLETCMHFLEENGIKFVEDPLIKRSPDNLLLQSSLPADTIEVEFKEGKRPIPGSFVELIERKIDPKYDWVPHQYRTSEHRREGFAGENAVQIFESTMVKDHQ